MARTKPQAWHVLVTFRHLAGNENDLRLDNLAQIAGKFQIARGLGPSHPIQSRFIAGNVLFLFTALTISFSSMLY